MRASIVARIVQLETYIATAPRATERDVQCVATARAYLGDAIEALATCEMSADTRSALADIGIGHRESAADAIAWLLSGR